MFCPISWNCEPPDLWLVLCRWVTCIPLQT